MKGNLKSQAQSRIYANRPSRSEVKQLMRPKGATLGLWGYCIRPTTMAPLKMKGIAPRTAAYCLRFKDIEAVVSDAPINQFTGKEMKDRIENDPQWLERSLRCHHNTIVKAGVMGPIIPMKFGMLFKTKRSFEAMLKNYYEEFKNLLAELKNKQELGVKVYLNRKKIIEQLKSEDKELKRFEKRKNKLAEGMKWYMERKIEAAISEKLHEKIERCLEEIIEVLEQLAEKVAINDLPASHDEETSGKNIILNSACLTGSENAKSFKEHLEKSLAEFYRSGFTIEISGPWPPYNFVGTVGIKQQAEPQLG